MSAHWQLALRFAVWVLAVAVLASMVCGLLYGGAYAVALVYGAAVGTASFVSTALTASLITGRSTAAGMAVGGGSFVARLGFAAVALGVPAYMGWWPAVTMLISFAAVYAAENVLLVPVLLGRRMKTRGAGRVIGERVERRAKV